MVNQQILKSLMHDHVELTDSARNLEDEKTELYLETRREIVSNYNLSNAESILTDLDISNEKVEFISQYAPMIICSLSSDEIMNASENANVKSITKYDELNIEVCGHNPSDMTNSKNSLGINTLNQQLSLTGNNVDIGIFETDCVSTQYTSDYGIPNSHLTVIGTNHVETGHATACAGIAAGNIGVAPDAHIYSASSYDNWYNSTSPSGHYGYFGNIEALISNGVNVINISMGGNNIINCYDAWANYLDYIIAYSKVTVTCATGNYPNEFILNFSSAFNCIAVNGYVCNRPDTYEEGNFLNYFSYNNGYGCIKPDVVAPSLNAGTSYSAPFICGIIALLYQYKPSLKSHPEAIKAILLASCHEKCSTMYVDFHNVQNTNETMNQGLTDKQGAGIPNIYKMISIVAQHSYGYGELNSANSYNRKVNIVQPKYGATKINVSMAYLQTNVTINQPGTCDDYDINLNNSDFNTTKYSTNDISSSEMIYTDLTDDDKYELEIHKYGSGSMTNVKYGYAWSTDNTSYYANPYMNGIYYIKNAKSGKYLTLNTNSNNAYQNNFTGADNQLWIVDRSSGTDDNIKSAGGNDASLEIGNLISNSYYYASPQSTDSLVFLISNNDGTFSLEKQHSNNWFKLGIFNNSTNNGASAAWYNSSDTNLSQRWYFEAVEYKKGDVNHDGEINQSDVTIITNMYSNPQNTYSNLERYLADSDGNGIINAADVPVLNQNN